MSLLVAAYSLRLRDLAEKVHQACAPAIERTPSAAAAIVAGALRAALPDAFREGVGFGSAWVGMRGREPRQAGELPGADETRVLSLASQAVSMAVAVYQMRTASLRLRSAIERGGVPVGQVQGARALGELMTAAKTEIQAALDAAGQVGIREVTP